MTASSGRKIEGISRADLEDRLRAIAGRSFPAESFDRRELDHLVRVVTNDVLLLTDLYTRVSIRDILETRGAAVPPALQRLLERAGDDSGGRLLSEVQRLPDRIKTVGDKCLFDVGLSGQSNFHGIPLKDLGMRSYELASEILERLGEDPRLSRFFRENRLENMPFEEEVSFLHQCSHRFAVYARLLQALRIGSADENTVPQENGGPPAADTPPSTSRVQASPAPAVADPVDGAAETGPDGNGDGQGREALVAHFPGPGTEVARERLLLSREELLAAWERILLFSMLDIDRLITRLSRIVVAQEGAIRALADDFALHAAGTRSLNRPPSYLFVGPTGVGKNYLVETLIELLEEVWGIDIPLLTLEGPNYTYPSDINELRGATRGFIRSDEEGILTEFHRRAVTAPLSVILIDEVEKAHSQLRKFFLSVMDRGTITDNRGQVLNFANSMLMYTSNIGYSDLARQSAPIGYADQEASDRRAAQTVGHDLRRSLSPEFVNRLRLVHFDFLSPAAIDRIFDLELARIARRFLEVHGLELVVTREAKAEILRLGYSHDNGARFLRTVMESRLNVEVSRKIKTDERGRRRGTRRLVEQLRELKGGKRPFDIDEIRRRVLGQARARVAYRRVLVDFRDDDFTYTGGST